MHKLQRYVSSELTHFVGRSLSGNEDQYNLLKLILESGWITHDPHDPDISGNLFVLPQEKISENNMYRLQSVCYCPRRWKAT